MKWLRPASLVFALGAVLAPCAHLLELPNKLSLDGHLWLAVQQHLYRGWGPFIGAPAEIGALIVSGVLALLPSQAAAARRLSALAAILYAAMIGVFFVFNAPVNRWVAARSAATLSSIWASLRMQWEMGHALAAVLGLLALVTSFRSYLHSMP